MQQLRTVSHSALAASGDVWPMKDSLETLTDGSLELALMSPAPMARALAVHALEVEARRQKAAIAGEVLKRVERFTGRGLPYFAPTDPGYRAWVAHAVALWHEIDAPDSRRPQVPQSKEGSINLPRSRR
jgi:hypothetical protein